MYCSVLSTVATLLTTFSTAVADVQPTPSTPLPPTRLFTAAAFLSPYPAGTSGTISGVALRAQGGSFYLDPTKSKPNTGCGSLGNGGYSKKCPPGNETVLWVDRWSQTWLVSPSFAFWILVSQYQNRRIQ
jgi:hypothetical protein